jgi:CRP-like cAMP-binding protein
MVSGSKEFSFSEFGGPIMAERLVSNLDPRERKRLSTIMRDVHIKKGTTIIQPDAVPENIVYLKEGRARILGDRDVRPVEQGELFGFTEILAGVPFDNTLVAVTDCNIVTVKRDDLIRYLRDTPDVCYRSLELVAETLHAARVRVADG